jgi:AraC family transcriptional regulator of adaptative response/methylated-DNA-[protein]-cysteine methyltransferase
MLVFSIDISCKGIGFSIKKLSKIRVEEVDKLVYFCIVMDENINYKRVEEAIKFLTENFKKQPSLYDVAEHAQLSPFHFQKIFTEWAGISPKKFLQYLSVEELKKELLKTSNLSEAAERVGLSSQSRIYDLFVNIEAVTPYEYKTKGAGINIEYGIHNTLFGECLVAITERGICSMSFLEDNADVFLAELQSNWQHAGIKRNQAGTQKVVENMFNTNAKNTIKLLVKGTTFQLKVWEALLKIPFGSLVSYQTIANGIDSPNAMRAVGSAVGANPVAYLIPCHRVIRQEAIIGQYRWGSLRKTALIGWEKAKRENNL